MGFELEMNDLHSIKAFNALCQHHSVTAAALSLNQPKSTVSRRLAQLEDDLGQTLFIKKGNKLVITRAGEVFANYCLQFLYLAEESKNALQALNQTVAGDIKLMCSPSLIRSWLGSQLNDFLNDNEEVSIHLQSEQREDHCSQPPDLILSVGELALTGSWHKLVLGEWQYGIYAAPSYLKRFTVLEHPWQLTQHAWVPSESTWDNKITLNKGSESYDVIPRTCRLISDSLPLQIDSIAQGLGVGLLPKWTAKKYGNAHPGQIQACLPQWQGKPMLIVCYCAVGVLPLRVQRLLEILQQNVPMEWKPSSDFNKVTPLPSYQQILNGLTTR